MATRVNGEDIPDHIPFNTSPMEREERFKEIEQPGTGTPISKQKKAEKKGVPAKKQSLKKKAKMAGGDEPT